MRRPQGRHGSARRAKRPRRSGRKTPARSPVRSARPARVEASEARGGAAARGRVPAAGPAKKKGILERLEEGVVLGDGGYLLELEKRGYVQAGPFTPEVVIEHPEAVLQLHREFVLAGSEVLQALTFYASREKLATTGYAGRIEEINRAAVRLAREAAGDHALVAGNLSLTWMYDPKDPKSPDRVRRLFDQQLELQVEEGIDFVICETYSFLGEALLAVERALETGLPVMATICFEQKPVTTDGRSPAECARSLEEAGAHIVGVNCLWQPRHMLPAAVEMRQAVRSAFVAAQPVAYCTTDECRDFTALRQFPFEMDGMQLSRRDMAEFARAAKEADIRYVGACCGAVASHIREMARALGKIPAQDRSWRLDYTKPMSAYEYYDHHEQPPAARR